MWATSFWVSLDYSIPSFQLHGCWTMRRDQQMTCLVWCIRSLNLVARRNEYFFCLWGCVLLLPRPDMIVLCTKRTNDSITSQGFPLLSLWEGSVLGILLHGAKECQVWNINFRPRVDHGKSCTWLAVQCTSSRWVSTQGCGGLGASYRDPSQAGRELASGRRISARVWLYLHGGLTWSTLASLAFLPLFCSRNQIVLAIGKTFGLDWRQDIGVRMHRLQEIWLAQCCRVSYCPAGVLMQSPQHFSVKVFRKVYLASSKYLAQCTTWAQMESLCSVVNANLFSSDFVLMFWRCLHPGRKQSAKWNHIWSLEWSSMRGKLLHT